MAAAACGGRATPHGWAPARAVEVGGKDMVLVPYKSKLFSLQPDSATANWQFPPKDKGSYPVSEDASTRIKEMIDALSIEGTAKKELEQRVDDLRLTGDTKDTLKKAIDASAASAGEKKDLKTTIDAAVTFESDALKKLQAIYGDLGLSSDGETVYVTTFRGMVFALDTDTGTPRWVRDAGSQIVGGVAVDGDMLFFGTKDKRLYAIDARTGERTWAFEAKGEVWSTPTLDGGAVYITSLDGTVYAIDKAAGTATWTFEGARSGIAAQPVVADGAVYVGAFDNRLYALNAADGTMKWSIKGDNWFWAKPVVEGGIVYAASLDGKVYALRAEDGSDAWPEPFDAGAPVRSSPVVAGDGLVVVARNAVLYKLSLETGEQLGGSPADLTDESTVEADLALVAEGKVYVLPKSSNFWIFATEPELRSQGSFPLPN
ncbi:MAG TPA: PQQ-binding-like beta-propeller repeat protein [Dehalococcoidia bacterium]|nr:PQQ-binding-like beta-propeller repeat protein [Dehalococcoidia bacterium]